MDNPHLFLIREPAVHSDLKLTEDQQTQIDRLNAELDPTLLAIRNQGDANERFNKLTEESQRQATAILTKSQKRRMDQIRLRIGGWRYLLRPRISEHLELTPSQTEGIQEALESQHAVMASVQSDIASGKKSQTDGQTAIREEAQALEKKLLDILSEEQSRSFEKLLGDPFPLDRLMRVAFNAPDFSSNQSWIQSEPLTLEKLKGKVVALHFFAFG